MNLFKPGIDPILHRQVVQAFKDAVRIHKTCNSELKKVLLKEPKSSYVEQYLDKLTLEFQQVNDLRLKQGKGLASSKYVKELVHDMTNYFVHGMNLKFDRRAESDLARLAREKSLDDFKEKDSTADGKPLGEFAEAGVITDETQVPQRPTKSFAKTKSEKE